MAAELPGMFAPDDVADIGRPSGPVDAGRKESRVYKIKVVRRKCECSIQVVNLQDVVLATVTPTQILSLPGQICNDTSTGLLKGTRLRNQEWGSPFPVSRFLTGGTKRRFNHSPVAKDCPEYHLGSCAGQCPRQLPLNNKC